MAKNLLVTHIDLDGISPIILLNLTGIDFEYKTIEISEVLDTFNELIENGLENYENVYITDLTIPDEIYKKFNEKNLTNIKVFDHHETHLYANQYNYATVKVTIDNIPTCGTELFYLYLKDIYSELNTKSVSEYVKYVRELDTFLFTSDLPKDLDLLKDTYGNLNFIKSITKRLKRNSETFNFTAFEKRFTKIKKEELTRYLQKKDKKMLRAHIDGKYCGISFAETNKSELGNYLSVKYPELDLIILIDASSRISYRTAREDIRVNDFASTYGGGGHVKASGSDFNDDNRKKIIEEYYKDVKWEETTQSE